MTRNNKHNQKFFYENIFLIEILRASFSKGQAGASTEYLKYFCFSSILIPSCNMKEKIQNYLVWWYVDVDSCMATRKFRSNRNWFGKTNIAANLNAIPLLWRPLGTYSNFHCDSLLGWCFSEITFFRISVSQTKNHCPEPQ